jgi:hypothetical protein
MVPVGWLVQRSLRLFGLAWRCCPDPFPLPERLNLMRLDLGRRGIDEPRPRMSKGRSLNLKSDQGHLQPRVQYAGGPPTELPQVSQRRADVGHPTVGKHKIPPLRFTSVGMTSVPRRGAF